MGSATFHRKHGKSIHTRAVSPNPTCRSGGFYKAPSNGATVDSLKPLDIEWDSTCLDTEKVDIYLLAPWINRESTQMTVWTSIPFAPGKVTKEIKPKWWNSTASASLQLTIVPAGTPPGLTTLPAGPVITATYTAPADGSIPPSADTSKPDTPGAVGAASTKRLSPGATAAAVLVPLLFVGLAIYAFLRWQRRKAAKHTQAFSQAVDKRMSTLSVDWKSMSPAGAQAAIRSSMAVRDSSAFAFGGIRPMSSASHLANDGDHGVAQMTQVRTGTGVGLRHPNTAALAAQRASRVSKVSFADAPRPSGDSRRTKAPNSTYIPPVPSRNNIMSTASVYPDSELEREEKREKSASPTLSPRQASGPLTLTADDIRARIQGQPTTGVQEQEKEYDEVMPALSMMRTGIKETNPAIQPTDDYILPVPPAPTHAPPTPPSPPSYTSALSSPYTPAFPTAATYASSQGTTPTQSPFTISAYAAPSSPLSPLPPMPVPGTPPPPPPPAGMSPDDMLRAYAERQAASTPVHNAPASPKTSKGRKLSLRASFGLKKAHAQNSGVERGSMVGFDRSKIGYPMQTSSTPLPPASPVPGPVSPGAAATYGETPVYRESVGMGAGMAGVGARKTGMGMGMGMAGVGAAGIGAGVGASYAIGEDDEEDQGVDYESAYVGTAN